MKKNILRILTVVMLACFGAIVFAACGDDKPAPEEQTYRVYYSDGVDDAAIAVPTDTTQYKAGDTVTVRGGIDRTHFTFTGWSEGSAHYDAGDTFVMPARNVMLTAGWTADVYDITFSAGDAEGATGLPAAAEATAGAYNLPEEEPQLTGKKFLGWKVENDETLYKYGGEHASYDVAGPTEFVAQWEQLYLLSYEDGVKDATIAVPAAAYYETGTQLTVEALADIHVRAGYIFAGWTDGDAMYAAGDPIAIEEADITLTAVWLPDIVGVWSGTDEGSTNDLTIVADGADSVYGHLLRHHVYSDEGISSVSYEYYPIGIGNGYYYLMDGMGNDRFELGDGTITLSDFVYNSKAALPGAPTGVGGTWHGVLGVNQVESELTLGEGDAIAFSDPTYQNGGLDGKIEFTGYSRITIGKYILITVTTSTNDNLLLVVTKEGSGIRVYFNMQEGDFTAGKAIVKYLVTFQLENDGSSQRPKTRYVEQDTEIGELPTVYLYETWSGWLRLPDNDNYFTLANGYGFDGWFVEGQDNAIDEHYHVTADITVTGKIHFEVDYSRAPTVTFYDSATNPKETVVVEKDKSHFSYNADLGEWTLTAIPSCTFTNGSKEFKGWIYFGLAPDAFTDDAPLVPTRLTGEGAPYTVGGSVNLTADVVTDLNDVPTSYAFYALWDGDVFEDLTPPREPYAVGYWQTSVEDRSQIAFFYVEALDDGTLYGVLIYGREGNARSLAGALTVTEAEGAETYTFCGKQFTLSENARSLSLTVNFGAEDITLALSRGTYENQNVIYGEYAYFDDPDAYDPKYIIEFDTEGTTVVHDSSYDVTGAEVKWLADGSIGIISVDEDPTLAENIVTYVIFSWSGFDDFPTVFYMISGSSSYELQGS